MSRQDKQVGRPEAYKRSFNKQVEKLCKLGATDKELADFFDVCEKTINNWKTKYPQFLQSIKKGKQIADMNVANSLYKRAVGYTGKDIKRKFKTIVVDDVSKEVECEREEATKHFSPDVTAQIFWLKNRQPKKWRDTKTLAGDKDNPVAIKINNFNLDKLSDAHLDALAEIVKSAEAPIEEN